jgi:DNA polymerase-3 subunit gamma/tau
MKKLYADLLEHFRNLLVAALGQKVDKLIDLPSAEVEQLAKQANQISAGTLSQLFDMLFKEGTAVRLSPQPKLVLEMALVRMLQAGPVLPIDLLIERIDDLRNGIFASGPQPDHSPAPMPLQKSSAPEFPQPSPQSSSSEAGRRSGRTEDQSDAVAPSPTTAGSRSLAQKWQQIVETVARQNPSLAANLAKCQIRRTDGRTLEIEVDGNGFTLNMIQREKNMTVLNKVCTDILGRRYDIKFIAGSAMDDKNKKKKDKQLKQKKAISHPLVADAIEIFDGSLVEVKIL